MLMPGVDLYQSSGLFTCLCHCMLIDKRLVARMRECLYIITLERFYYASSILASEPFLQLLRPRKSERQEIVYHMALRHIMITRIHKVELPEILVRNIKAVLGIHDVRLDTEVYLQLRERSQRQRDVPSHLRELFKAEPVEIRRSVIRYGERIKAPLCCCAGIVYYAALAMEIRSHFRIYRMGVVVVFQSEFFFYIFNAHFHDFTGCS